MRYINLFLIGIFLFCGHFANAVTPAPTPEQTQQTMKIASQFMLDKVSYRGGFVWSYLPDFSRQWGELEARRSMIWMQPPGTASVGHRDRHGDRAGAQGPHGGRRQGSGTSGLRAAR